MEQLVTAPDFGWFLEGGVATDSGACASVLDLALSGHSRITKETEFKGDVECVQDVVHDGITILRKTADGSSCSGYTFLVAMKVARQRGLLAEKQPYQVKRFQREWYGTTKESRARQLVLAMENLGMGYEVRAADAQPGDFVVFNRPGGPGHSAIFLNWIVQNGIVVGLRYRSSQNWTLGVDDYTEYFVTSGRPDATLDTAHFYVGRLR